VDKSNITFKTFDDDGIEMDSRDFACVVLPDLDYDAQLISIRYLLRIHENVDQELIKEIKEIEEFAKNTTGRRNEYAVDEWVDRLHSSVYQSAAHSMSAVGMLAPLMESVFHQAFNGIHEKLFTDEEISIDHIRSKIKDDKKWDCHFVFDEKSTKKDLVGGIIQLSDATGLKQFLPHDIEMVLRVLFSYRNKMFHCGFEWPMEERICFWECIQNGYWPENWLDKATIGNDPWIIYLTGEFIQHCINTTEKVIEALGNFVVNKSGIAQQ
jgi:hypothetical protein